MLERLATATLSKEHYDAYCRYRNFVGDEATLKKYKSVDRAHKAFARAERMKSKALTELIARGDTVGSCEAFKGVWEQRLKKELAAIAGVGDVIKLFDEQEFASRIDWSEVNASNSTHVVVWVSWKFKGPSLYRGGGGACWCSGGQGDPAVGTLSIWAHKGARSAVFEAATYGTNLGYMKSRSTAPSARPATGASLRTSFHKVLRRQLQKARSFW